MAEVATSLPSAPLRFPQIEARDLRRRHVALPQGFEGERNVALVAFRREHQALVDSWVPWLERQAAGDPGLRFYELPVIGTAWSPARPVIDGGMARAIGDPEVLRRTLTVYTDVTRVTRALGIADTATIGVLLVDDRGGVWWRGAGGFGGEAAAELAAALAAQRAGSSGNPDPDLDLVAGPPTPVRQFDFAWEPRFRPLLAAVGVVPAHAHVTVTTDRLLATFGPWTVETPLANVVDVCATGPYRAYRAIGTRLSLADRGLTFGTTTAGGVCVRFAEPVRGIDPLGLLRHPGLTVTVADPAGLVGALERP